MNSRPLKLLITGATGLLGHALVQEACKRYAVTGLARHPGSTLNPCPMEAADLQDADKLRSIVRKIAPDIVIHAAAMVSVDQCQKDPDTAYAVNVEGTRNLLRSLEGSSCRFLFISTDSVFDGRTGDYREEDAVNPIHIYGKSKLEAEKLTLQNRPDALVVRTSFYGSLSAPGRRSQNLAESILSRLKEGREVFGFTDLLFCPIPTTLLAAILLELVKKPASGILHVAGSQGCSKYEFARQLAAAFGFPVHLVVPATSDAAGLTTPRPRNATLNTEKAARLLGRPLPNLQEGLQAFQLSEPMIETRPV